MGRVPEEGPGSQPVICVNLYIYIYSYNAEIGKKRDLHGGPIFRNLAMYEGHSKSFETRYQGVKLGTSNLAES